MEVENSKNNSGSCASVSNDVQGLVSAVVTTYKRPDSAKRAIHSVLAQTYQPIEILVVEDGSDSDLEQWCNREAPERITYIRHEYNKGLAASRNTGLMRAKGSYVAYLDDDDEWKPERIKKQIEVISKLSEDEKCKFGVISCCVEVQSSDKNLITVYHHGTTGNLKESIKQHGLFTPPSSFLFSKFALEKVNGFDETLPSSIDHDVWMSLANNDYYGYAVNEVLVVTYERARRKTMMNDVSSRVIGVRKYLDKWEPIYVKWFGASQAIKYRQRYFAKVISNLVAAKFWDLDFKNAYIAAKQLYTYSNAYILNSIMLGKRIMMVGSEKYFPGAVVKFVKVMKNKFIQ